MRRKKDFKKISILFATITVALLVALLIAKPQNHDAVVASWFCILWYAVVSLFFAFLWAKNRSKRFRLKPDTIHRVYNRFRSEYKGYRLTSERSEYPTSSQFRRDIDGIRDGVGCFNKSVEILCFYATDKELRKLGIQEAIKPLV